MEEVLENPRSLSVPSALSLSRILRAFTLTSSVALLTVLLSVVTNKIVSVVTGPEGVAVMGLFRTFGALVAGVVGLGYATLFNQKAAYAEDAASRRKVLQMSLCLFLLQSVFILALMFFGVGLFSHWVLHEEVTPSGALAIRLVLLMALVNAIYQNAAAIMRGASLLKEVSLVQAVVSIASLALIYPLLKMGRAGLAINVGSGCVFGLVLGIYLIRRHYAVAVFDRPFLKEAWHGIRSHLSSSLLLIWQAAFWMGCLFGVQSLIGKACGLDYLGNFNATYLMVDTGLLILVSSLRSYFLPELAKLKTPEEKRELLFRTLYLHLGLAFLGSAVLIVGAKPLVFLLFSRKFQGAIEMLPMMALGVIGFVYTYIYNTFLLHSGRYRDFVLIDTVWGAFFLALVYGLTHFLGNTHYLFWAYPVTALMSAILYVSFVALRHGRMYFSWRITLVTALGICLLVFLA